MIARHIGNVGTEIGLDHWPNIYCGVAVLMFLLLYLGAKKITVRGKGSLLRPAVNVLCQLFHQCVKFHLAWVPLSKQPSMQTVLYLYRLGADYVLSGLPGIERNFLETGGVGVLGCHYLCAHGRETCG